MSRGRLPTAKEIRWLPDLFSGSATWSAERVRLRAAGRTGGCCASCSTEAQLLYLGTTIGRVDRMRLEAGLPKLAELELWKAELFFWWLLRHRHRFEVPLEDLFGVDR